MAIYHEITDRQVFRKEAAERLGFKECAHGTLREDGVVMGVFEAKRTKDKTGRWLFKKGDFTVTLKARYEGRTWVDPEVSTRTIIEEGRFKSASTAIDGATKQIRREWPGIARPYHGHYRRPQ